MTTGKAKKSTKKMREKQKEKRDEHKRKAKNTRGRKIHSGDKGA